MWFVESPRRNDRCLEAGFAALPQVVSTAGGNAEIIVDGTAIAICNVSGEYHAVSNACPHAGSALGKGDISGKNLRCPDHDWRFDVTDGSCLTLPGVKLPIYAVHIEHEAVCVKL